jgi:Ran GTPase-activating protein (RanGAP) involved in mRNA processing and transport
VTDAGLVHLLNCPRLMILDLEDTAITDAGLLTLAKIQTLKNVSLQKTKVTEGGVKALAKAFPKGLTINLDGGVFDPKKK